MKKANYEAKVKVFTPQQVNEPVATMKRMVSQWMNPTGKVEMRNIRINVHRYSNRFELEMRYTRDGKLTKWFRLNGTISDEVRRAFTEIVGLELVTKDGEVITDYSEGNRDIFFNQILKNTDFGDMRPDLIEPVNPRIHEMEDCWIDIPIMYSCDNKNTDIRMNPFKVHLDETVEPSRVRLMMFYEQSKAVKEYAGGDKYFFDRNTMSKMSAEEIDEIAYRFNYKDMVEVEVESVGLIK